MNALWCTIPQSCKLICCVELQTVSLLMLLVFSLDVLLRPTCNTILYITSHNRCICCCACSSCRVRVLCPDCSNINSIKSEAQAMQTIQQQGSSDLGFLQFFNLHRSQALIAGTAHSCTFPSSRMPCFAAQGLKAWSHSKHCPHERCARAHAAPANATVLSVRTMLIVLVWVRVLLRVCCAVLLAA